MASSDALDYAGAARTNDVIVGALAASAAIIAAWETTRPLRRVNFALGLWLVAAPWLLGFDWTATANSVIVGALMAALAAIRGRIESRFGGGWSVLWKAKKAKVEI